MKILLNEMKLLVPNYSCLQNPWLGGYRPQIPVLSVLAPQLNFFTPPTPTPWTKFQGMPLLRSFLGLVNYYQSFVPNMRSICQPLDEPSRRIMNGYGQLAAKKCLRALKVFLIPTSSSLTMTHRLKWSLLQMHQNTDWAPSYNTGGQMAQSRPLLMLHVHWNWQNRTTARLRRRARH